MIEDLHAARRDWLFANANRDQKKQGSVPLSKFRIAKDEEPEQTAEDHIRIMEGMKQVHG